MTINYRKSDYSLADQKMLERYNRRQRNEYTKWEVVKEVVGAIAAMVVFALAFVLYIHL